MKIFMLIFFRFLATGWKYECMKFSAIISPQVLGKIIPETCDAIYKVIRQEYLKASKSKKKSNICFH